jgi:outer membrane protein OmpA-like peptidoglycan-associated protein
MDGDGINDDVDQCVTVPGDAENNGCPPPVKPELAKRILFVAQNVQFRSSSSKLTPGSLPVLHELADTLKASPDLDLTIEGHTDNSGSPEYNQKLSEQRAAEVRKELIKMGVAPERISIQGFGDTQPIGDNDTKEGRSKNRRVVFRLHVKNS